MTHTKWPFFIQKGGSVFICIYIYVCIHIYTLGVYHRASVEERAKEWERVRERAKEVERVSEWGRGVVFVRKGPLGIHTETFWRAHSWRAHKFTLSHSFSLYLVCLPRGLSCLSIGPFLCEFFLAIIFCVVLQYLKRSVFVCQKVFCVCV